MKSGSEHVYDALVDAGVELAVGIPGRHSLPLDTRIREDDEMRYVMARHETAIPYVAWGYYETGGGPAATITVPGPGDTNASNGLRNATMDQVPMVHLSTDVPPEQRGKGALHEVDPSTFDAVVKENVDVTNPNAVPSAVAGGIEAALTPPYGPVRIGMPYLGEAIETGAAEATPESVDHDNGDAYERVAELLASAERPVVYAGVGARRSADGPAALADLVETLDAPVVGSYKGKGAFPETDPRWAGTTGAQLPAGAVEMLDRADVVLALGTLFDVPTTRDASVPMGEHLVHVTVDPDQVDRVYEADAAILDDVGTACRELTARLEGADAGGWDGAAVGRRVREEYLAFVESEGMFRQDAPAATPAVLRALREALPEEAIAVADIAEFRTWALQLFEAPRHDSFILTGAWTSMGVGLPGALGAKLANPDRPVVCLTGDGGLMQCVEELHTAAEEGLDVTTVVFNNAAYGMINTTPGLTDRFGWESPDLPAIAEGFGCGATTVETPPEAAAAVEDALDTDRPELVNVLVDPDEPSSMDAWRYESEIEFP